MGVLLSTCGSIWFSNRPNAAILAATALIGNKNTSLEYKQAREHCRTSANYQTYPILSEHAVNSIRVGTNSWEAIPESVWSRISTKDIFWINLPSTTMEECRQFFSWSIYADPTSTRRTACCRCGHGMDLCQRHISGLGHLAPAHGSLISFLWFACGTRCAQGFIHHAPSTNVVVWVG
jgi:hypothetical protein